MKEALELIKKHGATAVLLIWLYHTHSRVEKLEHKLYDCLETKRVSIQRKIMNVAILPKKIENETESNS